jgi:serine protease Do
MKSFSFKWPALASVLLIASLAGDAQEKDTARTKIITADDGEEIIIRHKGDKDSRIVLEIKNNQVFINGKPVDEFEDENISVKKLKDQWETGDLLAMAPHSPFRVENLPDGSNFYWDDMDGNSKRAFLGVSAEKAKNGGAQIREVTKGSAAEKSGLKEGDVITRIDQTGIADPQALTETIRKHAPDDKVIVTFLRDGKEQKVTATLGKLKEMKMQSFRFAVPRVNPEIHVTPPPTPDGFGWNSRPRLGIRAQDTEDGKGVKVLDVDEDSPADKAGVKEGDIITQFDGKAVNSASGLADLARGSMAKQTVKIRVLRGGKTQDLDVKIPRKLKTTDF